MDDIVSIISFDQFIISPEVILISQVQLDRAAFNIKLVIFGKRGKLLV